MPDESLFEALVKFRSSIHDLDIAIGPSIGLSTRRTIQDPTNTTELYRRAYDAHNSIITSSFRPAEPVAIHDDKILPPEHWLALVRGQTSRLMDLMCLKLLQDNDRDDDHKFDSLMMAVDHRILEAGQALATAGAIGDVAATEFGKSQSAQSAPRFSNPLVCEKRFVRLALDLTPHELRRWIASRGSAVRPLTKRTIEIDLAQLPQSERERLNDQPSTNANGHPRT